MGNNNFEKIFSNSKKSLENAFSSAKQKIKNAISSFSALSPEIPDEQKPPVKKKPAEHREEIEQAKIDILPTRVDGFDRLLEDHGMERGSTILVSGGAGTGKTTFCIQSLYYGALSGEKGLYISFEEEPKRIRAHMKKDFGWDIAGMEKKGLLAVVKFDPVEIARRVEAALEKETGLLKIELKKIKFPIVPDRIAVDSLSALSIEFESEENFRKYLKELFELLVQYNSVNYVISETEQNPRIYSKTGVEEFLTDGVVVLYNIKEGKKRKNAIEILKMRGIKHWKRMVPYEIGKDGINIIFE